MAFVPVSIKLIDGEGAGATSYDRSIEVTARQMAAFSKAAGDLTVPLTGVAEGMRGQIETAFATQGLSGASGKWTALSPQYAAWKAKRGPGLPLLFGLRPTRPVHHRPQKPNMNQQYAPSGKMMEQLLTPLADQLTWQITSNRMRYTPASNIAGFHETGTEKMPARPPVDLSITFLHQIDRTFVRWLAGLVKDARL